MVHLPVYTVHVPWTMKEMLDLQKKKKKKKEQQQQQQRRCDEHKHQSK